MNSGGGARGLERLWYGDSPLALLLQPFAWVFGAAVALRRRLYRAGWLASERVPVPVIVIGNITIGGAGKTPLVDWLVRRLLAAGSRPGIVSRGYGGRMHDTPVRVSKDSLAEDIGDEPLLLARRTGVPVLVCTNRGRAARTLAEEGADVIVADDGLQHYALHRDLEILVVDGERRLGNGRLLPAGPLREPPSRLGEAAMVLANGGPSDLPWPRFDLTIGVAQPLRGGEPKSLRDFAGRPAWVLAGIGNPGRFHAALRRIGIEVHAVRVPDHGSVDLAALRIKKDWPVLMTEKDAVKYPQCVGADLWFVPAEVQMQGQVEQMLLSKVFALLRGRASATAAAPGAGRG
jgi:tetraacyldisaccharide 4'-kinase